MSPTIAGLVDQRGADALVTRLRTTGSPLIEPDPGDAAAVLATFVWQGRSGSGRVALDAAGLTDRDWFSDSLLEPVPNTDLSAVTLRVPRTWRGAYGFAVDVDGEPPAAVAGGEERRRWWLDLMARSGPDPLSRAARHDTSWGAARSEAAMPDAPRQRWWEAGRALADRGGDVVGVDEHRVVLAGVERPVWTLAPGDHTEPRATVVLFDGATWARRMPLAPSFTALDASGEAMPFVALMVDSVDPTTRSRELTASARFRAAICDELLPWAAQRFELADEPSARVAVGQSFGGLAAVDLALGAPEVFGGAVGQSSSFWWPSDEGPARAREHWRRRLAEARRSARLLLEAGLYEGDMHELTRAFVADARAVGHRVRHRELSGAHDPVQWREGAVDGVAALLGEGGWGS